MKKINILNEYYILSAHNCCCSGNNKNDYVDICAFENCIKQGARFLDFQIYNKNNKPVIASSSNSSFKYKEIIFYQEDVLKTINKKHFQVVLVQIIRPFITLFVYTNDSIYNKLADIYSILAPRLLSSINYSNESNGKNIFNKNGELYGKNYNNCSR